MWQIIRVELKEGDVVSRRVIDEFDSDRPRAAARLADSWESELAPWNEKFIMVETMFRNDCFVGIPVGQDRALQVMLREKT